MAGGVTLGFLKYVLGFDSITFRKGMTDAERDLVKLQKSFEAKGKAIQSFGKSLTAFVTLPLAGIAAAGIKEAQETQQAMAQVNASLASMGPVAQRSAGQLQTFANALELKSTFEADEILRKVTANLLTFGNIAGDSFDRAQQAAVDLATKMGTDLQSATLLVGKALNDPVKGMSALGRAGIQFSASQKKTIKDLVATGHAAKAQGLILNELERQFKGSAEAAANADPLNRATKAWKQMAETIGTALLPILPVITDAVVKVANAFAALSPQTQQTILIVGGLAAALGPVLIGFGGLVRVFASIGPAVLAVSTAFKALQAAFIATRLAALATLPALLPFLVPLAAIAAAVGVAYLAWKNWDKIKAIVASVYNAVRTYLVDKLNSVVSSVKSKIDAVIGFFRNLWDKVVGHSYVPDTINGVEHHFKRLHKVMVTPAEKAARAAAAAFKKLKEDVSQLMDQLFPDEAMRRQAEANVALLEKAAKAGLISAEKLAEAKKRIRDADLGPVLDQLFPEDAQFRQDIANIETLNRALANGVISFEKYAEARDRMFATGDRAFAVSPDLPNPQVIDQLPGGLSEDTINRILGKFDKLVDTSRDWGRAIADVGRQLSGIIGDDLARIVEGSARLKDLWKDLLGFAIRFLTSDSGIGQFFGGARALGGPVMAGSAYLVGEKGPEIFMPSSSGRVLSNSDSRAAVSGWGTSPVYMTVITPNADSFRRSDRQVTRSLQRRLR